MVSFSNNQRYSQKWLNGSFIEEVLAASGVDYDNSGQVVTSGSSDVQDAIEALDSSLAGLTSPPASGAVNIDEVVNVSGVSASSLGNIETIQFGSTNDPTAGFSFTVFAQPVDEVTVKTVYAITTDSQNGTVAYRLEYNIFDQGDDLTPATEFPETLSGTSAVTSGNFEQMRQFNFAIPLAKFTAAGTAPFVVNARLVRDSSADSFSGDVDILKVYADGIPGASSGTSPGYTGGNLTVTGDLTVENALIYEAGGVSVPNASGDAGTTGTLVYDDNYLYIKIAARWVRVEITSF